MATIQSSSPIHSPQVNPLQTHNPFSAETARRQLAVRLADSIVSRSYAPHTWSLYHRRFSEVLAEA